MNPDYHEIAASAELLHERIRNEHTEPSARNDGTAASLDGFDPEEMETLWTDREYESDSVTDYVGFERWPDDEPLPEWVAEFSDLMDALAEADPPASESVGTETEVPFEDVLRPVVAHCRETVRDERATDRLAEAGLRDFEQMLLDRLVDATAQALHVDFISFIAEREPEVVRRDRRSPDSTEWYDAYVAAFLDGRAAEFFEEYAVAARLVAVSVRQWRSVVAGFCSRLADDAPALRSSLGVERAERVVGVSPMGDAHAGGNRVLMVAFDSGDELLYKPRSVAPEARFYEFASWLVREFDGVPDLGTPDLVAGDGYGWVEKVERADHSDVESVARYYRGTGALLCLLYALNVTDCHYENLLAAEDSPVVVDPETVLEMGAAPADDPHWRVNEKLRRHVLNESVLGTGALPHDAMTDDSSGIAGIDGRRAQSRHLSWVHVNTDAVDVAYERPVEDRAENFPTLGGDPARPEHFVDEIVDGFERVYDAISGASDRVQAKVEDRFGGMETRTLLRSTRAYDALLKALTTPKRLRSGARYGYEIQRTLSMRPDAPTLRNETRMSEMGAERWERLVAAEREALARCDVPKFTAYADDAGLYFDGERVLDDVTARTGIERAQDRIAAFSADDKRRQSGLIRGCLEDADVTDKPHFEAKL